MCKAQNSKPFRRESSLYNSCGNKDSTMDGKVSIVVPRTSAPWVTQRAINFPSASSMRKVCLSIQVLLKFKADKIKNIYPSSISGDILIYRGSSDNRCVLSYIQYKLDQHWIVSDSKCKNIPGVAGRLHPLPLFLLPHAYVGFLSSPFDFCHRQGFGQCCQVAMYWLGSTSKEMREYGNVHKCERSGNVNILTKVVSIYL